MTKEYILFFDVESTSLHGVGFAVGAIVAHKESGTVIDSFQLSCIEGEEMANDWVKQNIIPQLISLPQVDTLRELREKFYEFYIKHKDKSDIWSDVNFPVETNFLSAVVNDDIADREWNAPYPLYDLATILDVDIDREKMSALDSLTKHNPYHDALASFTCWMIKMKEITALNPERSVATVA